MLFLFFVFVFFFNQLRLLRLHPLQIIIRPSVIYWLMNFETNDPFDQQLGRLLAIIIMCEKNIEEIRKKLAGNEEFHTRLIFQKLDYQRKGQITPEDLVYTFSSEHSVVTLPNSQSFCRKYSISGALTYEELLGLLTPKTDKSLSQRMLIRTTKRGASLPNYLWKYFCSLIVSLISMTAITQEMRRKIQKCTDLNHLEMVEFFRACLKTEACVWKFCNSNSDEEYDFTIQDARFLTTHIRSANSIRQMTDEDIKELICPLDMNFQKTVHEMANYFDDLATQKKNTLRGAFFEQTKSDQVNRKTGTSNFLNSKYKPFYANEGRCKQNQIKNYDEKPAIAEKQADYPSSAQLQHNIAGYDDGLAFKSSTVRERSQMYLDNFIKPVGFDSDRRAIELNGYLNEGKQKFRRSGYQKFEDPLSQNSASSQSNSAFIQY